MKHIFRTYFLLILCLGTITSCKDNEQEPDAKEFLHGKWEMSQLRMLSPRTFQVAFHEGGTADWGQLTVNGNTFKSYWVYQADGQKLSIYNPDMNFVVLEKNANELVVKEVDTGMYYTLKKVN